MGGKFRVRITVRSSFVYNVSTVRHPEEKRGPGVEILNNRADGGERWAMPRRLRHAAGGYVYHVLHRAVGRATLFHKPGDYRTFRAVLQQANDWVPMRWLGYCLM